jgi:hypothetical protein
VTFPAFIFEFSPGSAPFDTPSWVNISTRVAEAEWRWGRKNDLERFDTGTCRLKLYNHDRLFDPEYTAGTYFGDLLPRVPFRIRTSTKDLFYGFVQGGWEQDYEPPENSYCTVVLTDLFDVIAREVLPRSAYEGEILTDSPAAYWRLDETTGTVMGDSSGNGNHGLFANVTLGEDPLIVDTGGKSIFCTHVGDNRGEFRGESLPTAAPVTLEAWVKFPRDLVAFHTFIYIQRDSSLLQSVSLCTDVAANCPNGELEIRFSSAVGGGYKIRGHTRIDDDLVHHVACTINGTALADFKLYVDGVEQTKTVVSGTSGGTWAGLLWWTVGNTTDSGLGDFGIEGRIDEVAVYADDLSAARILAHYEAGSSAFENESTGDRIDRVLDLIGVPAGMRSISTGDTFMGPANYQGARVGDYLRAVVESEQGYLYVDHANGGKLTFKGRYSRFTDTRSITSQATFSDQTSATHRYERGALEIEPNGMQTVINRVEVEWPGGTEIVSAETTPYGPQSRRIRTEAPSPVVARSAGAWIIARYSEAQTRVRGLGVNPGGAIALQTPALDLRVGDMVTVVRQPQSIGSATTNVLIVEGVEHRLTNGLRWTASYTFSDADTADVWIWGTSAWNTDTFWG